MFETRVCGSADLYQASGRKPYHSVNFVTCHDGFTLWDLVSYNQKHNHANGEDNRDGAPENFSWNCGVEGETDDPAVNALRLRQAKNLIATLLLSQGVPMMLAGDERIVDNERTRDWVRQVNWPHRVISTYAQSRHTLEMDPDRERYLEELVGWLVDPEGFATPGSRR